MKSGASRGIRGEGGTWRMGPYEAYAVLSLCKK